jgi:hypothetical protein
MKILSIKNNSIRIRTGIVTFDVMYDTERDRIIIPKNIFIYDTKEFMELLALVKDAYKRKEAKSELLRRG